jgi:hypothetical protein
MLLLSLRSAAVLLYGAAASLCYTAAIGLTAAATPVAFVFLNATAAAAAAATVTAAGALLGRRRRR